VTTRELQLIANVREKFATGKAREIRLAAHVSRSEVAKAAGVSETALWRYENAGRSPHPSAALALARILTRLEREAKA
jgi:transcriptional regulator with XRE-family HTH domain